MANMERALYSSRWAKSLSGTIGQVRVPGCVNRHRGIMLWWHIGGCVTRTSRKRQLDGLRAPHVAPINALIDELRDPDGRGWVRT
jgi:hypothetical protein